MTPTPPYIPPALTSVVDLSGVTRMLGNLPSPPHERAMMALSLGSNPRLPESEWVEFDEWPDMVKIKDQGSHGACNGHAAALSLELARFAAGYPHTPLSAWWVYGNLTGGWDVGSNPMDALKLLTDTGCAPESDVPWGVFNPRKFSDQAKADAPRFKCELSGVITDPDELMTAVQLRRPVNGTVHASGAFTRLDGDGCPGGLSGGDNHAITLAFGAKKTTKHGWMIKLANSWTTDYGLKGFCWVPLSTTCRNRGCEYYAVAAAACDPEDKTNPPAPK